MTKAFSAKLLASQLPVLARRSTLLKRVMFAGIGLGLACLTSTLYFNHSASDLNAVSHFSYDIPQSLMTWSESVSKMNQDQLSLIPSLISLLDSAPVFAGIIAIIMIFGVVRGLFRDEPITDQLPFIFAAVFAGIFFWVMNYSQNDHDQTPSNARELAIALKNHNSEALLNFFNKNKDILTDPETKPANVSLIKEDLYYLDLQKRIKDGDDLAETNMQFVSSNYFINNRASFKPDTLTAIEKATYGHPVSERAKQYQISTIEPAIRNQRMRAHISASLMAIGFLTGVSAFVLYRGMRKRMKFLKTVSFAE